MLPETNGVFDKTLIFWINFASLSKYLTFPCQIESYFIFGFIGMTSSINEYVSLLLNIKIGLNSELISLLPKEYKYHDSSILR